jgi:hypothetical protein
MGVELALPTLWQHWRVPVLHWLEGEPDPPVAAARVATETVVRAVSLNCILLQMSLNEGGCDCSSAEYERIFVGFYVVPRVSYASYFTVMNDTGAQRT